MAVNGVEIEVGQVWITKDGREVYVDSDDGHGTYPFNIHEYKGGKFIYSVTRDGHEFAGSTGRGSELVRPKGVSIPEGNKYRDINGIPLKVGDRVKVVAKPTTTDSIRTPEYANGWHAPVMDKYVNDDKSKKITRITDSGVYTENTQSMGFPSWVLEKVKDDFQEALETTYRGDVLAMAKALFRA